MREVFSRSPEETRALAASLTYRAGDVVLLEGDLGAGKTTFVKGIADACGVDASVRSPTFALMHRYRGRPDLVHVDLYREAHASAIEDLDLEGEREGLVIVVEWPKALTGDHWPDARVIRLEHVDETTRRILLPDAD